MVAQVPQLVKNYKTKSAEALSAWFLAEWLLVGGSGGVGEQPAGAGGRVQGRAPGNRSGRCSACSTPPQQPSQRCAAGAHTARAPPRALRTQGDTCNLVGALLKGDQLPTVVFTAQYFICMDAVLLLQVRSVWVVGDAGPGAPDWGPGQHTWVLYSCLPPLPSKPLSQLPRTHPPYPTTHTHVPCLLPCSTSTITRCNVGGSFWLRGGTATTATTTGTGTTTRSTAAAQGGQRSTCTQAVEAAAAAGQRGGTCRRW